MLYHLIHSVNCLMTPKVVEDELIQNHMQTIVEVSICVIECMCHKHYMWFCHVIQMENSGVVHMLKTSKTEGTQLYLGSERLCIISNKKSQHKIADGVLQI